MVMLLHWRLIFFEAPILFERAYLAVDFFFMLSGYVMARTYEGKTFRHTAYDFLGLRYRRLWPPMAVGALIAVAYLAWKGISPLGIVLIVGPLFALLPNPLTRHSYGDFPVNAPAWSIFCELVGNFLHGLVLWRLKAWQLLAIAAVVLIVMQWFSPGMFTRDHFGLVKGLSRMLVAYCIGMALWRIKVPSLPSWMGVVGLPLTMIMLAGTHRYYDLVFLALCPVFIVSGLTMKDRTTAAIAGALSFPLYAVHAPVFVLVKLWGGSPLVGFAAALCAALLVALAVDRRLLRIIGSRSECLSSRSPASPSN